LRSSPPKVAIRGAARSAVPAGLIAVIAWPGVPLPMRLGAAGALFAFWAAVYARYRAAGRRQTRHEWELLRRTDRQALRRHYDERVPTMEQEFEQWGPYYAYKHQMRYNLVARAVRDNLPPGGRVLDTGCGAALVAARMLDLDAEYLGLDFGGPHIQYAARKLREADGRLRVRFVRADAEQIPLIDACVDVVVMSEVIEHLLRPDRAVWEVARVLRPGGTFIMTTNNACEVPLRSPLANPLAWFEKALGTGHPSLISHRHWVWPEPVDRELLPAQAEDVYVPHTHHIPAETCGMLASAGLKTPRWSTFEFPPPQSVTAALLAKAGSAGRRLADATEWVAQHAPLVNRLGTHLFMLARKTGAPVAADPPPGVWPGPVPQVLGPFPDDLNW